MKPIMLAIALSLAPWLTAISTADAGTLLKADWQGVAIKAEIAADFDRVRIEIDGRPYLFDAEAGLIHDIAEGSAHNIGALRQAHGKSVVPFDLSLWSSGPPVAGHRSRYNVLQVDELVCGEVLDSDWMVPFMKNIVTALSAVQALDQRLAPVDRGACGAADFLVYAQNGWPLVIGWRDAEIFRTDILRFDHSPSAEKLRLPKDADKTGLTPPVR